MSKIYTMRVAPKVLVFYIILATAATIIKLIFAGNIATGGITALLAISLFSGVTTQDKKYAMLLPLITLLMSDIAIELLYTLELYPFKGFYESQWINYLLIISVSLIGLFVRKYNTKGLIVGIVAGPLFYFLSSNFLVWMQNDGLGYSRNFNGLMQCYIAGIPFLRNSLLSTAVCFPLLLQVYHYALKQKLITAL